MNVKIQGYKLVKSNIYGCSYINYNNFSILGSINTLKYVPGGGGRSSFSFSTGINMKVKDKKKQLITKSFV